MIHIPHNTRIIVVRGVRLMIDIEAAILKATGAKRVRWRDWTMVCISDEDSQTITTGMPFTPPDVSVGFEYSKKNKRR